MGVLGTGKARPSLNHPRTVSEVKLRRLPHLLVTPARHGVKSG